MHLRASALAERLRSSLFFIPMFTVIGAVAFGIATLALDRRIGAGAADLPLGLVSTVEGARALLSTIAGATISFAGIAFSVSLLTIQQASSQYSPRVVHTLFRDPFNKRVMGLVVGTFTYCLIVLRSVRAPLDDSGTPVVPNLSVALAVVLGIATILAIVAFIDHSAHAMDVSQILDNVRREATDHIRQQWPETRPGPAPATAPSDLDGRASTVVRFRSTGWIQQVEFDSMFEAIAPGSTLVLQAEPGRYAIAGTTLATVTPPVLDVNGVADALDRAITIGATRTMQQDASYGLRQLADVALKALSPGINDPTTAQDAIFHSAAVLAELLQRDPPEPLVQRRDDKRLVAAQRPTHPELVRLAYDETRRAAADQPTVCIYLLEAFDLLIELLEARGLGARAEPIMEQARITVEGCRAAGLGSADLQPVEDAYRTRFALTHPRPAVPHPAGMDHPS